MGEGRIILTEARIQLTIERLCRQLIEVYDTFDQTCLIGIQPRGTFLANRLFNRLSELIPGSVIDFGKLDITFYRDDFRTREKPLKASVTDLNFLVENKNVILVDDVLYTGRTVQAALTALQHYGRAKKVDLLCLIDRRFNRHLPIKSDFTGIRVDAVDEAFVKVEWKENDGEDRVLLFPTKEESK